MNYGDNPRYTPQNIFQIMIAQQTNTIMVLIPTFALSP